MIFIFSAPYSYLLYDIKFCFHLRPIFRLLPSKIKILQKRWRTIQNKLFKEKKYCVKFKDSDVINSTYFRNPGKVKALLYVLCVEAISVLYMEEKMISIDIRTHQNSRDMWVLHNNKEN